MKNATFQIHVPKLFSIIKDLKECTENTNVQIIKLILYGEDQITLQEKSHENFYKENQIRSPASPSAELHLIILFDVI